MRRSPTVFVWLVCCTDERCLGISYRFSLRQASRGATSREAKCELATVALEDNVHCLLMSATACVSAASLAVAAVLSLCSVAPESLRP